MTRYRASRGYVPIVEKVKEEKKKEIPEPKKVIEELEIKPEKKLEIKTNTKIKKYEVE